MVEAQDFSRIPEIRHGFFDRQGGTSQGIYASLNCGLGSGDDKDTVLKNRIEVASRLDLTSDQLVNVHQIHSPDVVTITKPWTVAEAPKADGMVTNVGNIGLSILTADCAAVAEKMIFPGIRADVDPAYGRKSGALQALDQVGR